MKYIVITDLDGTLLDHQTYEFTAANDAIALLKKHHIPIILNSSKTRAEILDFRQQLHNQEPFICENGGVLCFPNLTSNNKYSTEYLGIPRQQFLKNLLLIKKELQLNYENFAHATVEDVMQWTGLTVSDAQKAMVREATEPLLWHDTEIALAKFRQKLQQLQLQCVKGGRFYHVMGTFNKASCFSQLRANYAQLWQDNDIKILALGDSQNDLPMLEQADLAIVIPSSQGIKIKPNRQDVFFATQPAPYGWQEGIEYFFKTTFLI
jgi:mannosyl-3-phosphoglycerate phosphatase